MRRRTARGRGRTKDIAGAGINHTAFLDRDVGRDGFVLVVESAQGEEGLDALKRKKELVESARRVVVLFLLGNGSFGEDADLEVDVALDKVSVIVGGEVEEDGRIVGLMGEM